MSRMELDEIAKKTEPDASVLGLDVGSKTIGIAAGNRLTRTASPITTINRKKFMQDIDALTKLVKEYGASFLVIGYPLNMDGTEGPRCQSIRDFAIEMEKHGLSMPYLLWDERLSTASVDRFWDSSVDKKKAKEKGLTDAYAAQIILSHALESMA
ncbi:MAG: Holliday junction resolvase RuvX [Pseudobdellovibrionaceae bacterium]